MTKQLQIPSGEVRGFNYQPGYSSCTFETWRYFDAEVFRRELANGKKHFPRMNTVRLWLSWNAWGRGPQKMGDALKRALDLCEEFDLKAIPVLYNRWHDSRQDCDGIYLDHFLPGSSWLLKYGLPGREYTRFMGETFKDDDRILAWDLCNEPFAYDEKCPMAKEFIPHELNWLKTVHEDLRSANITQPIGIGSWSDHFDDLIEDMVDCFLTHAYLHVPADAGHTEIPQTSLQSFQDKVDRMLDRSRSSGKPLIITETCWGSFGDAFRAELVRCTLEILRNNNIGFLAHALYESDCADLHRPEYGLTSPDIGSMYFISREGSIRPEHEIINQFM